MKEWKPEIISGKVMKFVDCSITLKVADYFVTIPLYRVLKIKHPLWSAKFSLSDALEGLDVEVHLIPEKEVKFGEKW